MYVNFMKMLLIFGLIVTVASTMMDIDPGRCPYYGDCKHSFKSPHSDAMKSSKTYTVPLDSDGEINLDWWLDYYKRTVTLKIEFSDAIPKFSWFAIGFSDYGDAENADYCVLTLNDDDDDDVNLVDTNTNEYGVLKIDDRNDCLDFNWDRQSRILQYTREFDTCDPEDYIIEEGTTHILWAYGEGFGDPDPSQTSSKDRGMVRVQLLKNENVEDAIPPDAQSLEVRAKDFKVPDKDTTYHCIVQRMPDWLLQEKHHVIRYASIITKGNEGLVHHIEVYYCDAPKDAPMDMYSGSCFERPSSTVACSKVRAAWAMGATPFVYPKQAGVPLGGPNSNAYIMLEIHYNNPRKVAKYVDSSGILIHLTTRLRKYEASIMELGLEYIDKMIIPPNQSGFPLSGYCTADCTRTGLPDHGIIVFGSQLHTHLTGVAIETRHYRNGMELPVLNCDNHYSSHFQEIRRLKRPVHVIPGDSLVTTCKYTTTSRTNVTFGGHSITDEMCVNYIHYYPASNLEVCKSSVSTVAMDEFFDYEKYWEDMPVQANNTVRENYNSIYPWNRIRVKLLSDLFQEKPISMQCNQSNGNRFPGFWDTVDRDIILTRLPIPKRPCKD